MYNEISRFSLLTVYISQVIQFFSILYIGLYFKEAKGQADWTLENFPGIFPVGFSLLLCRLPFLFSCFLFSRAHSLALIKIRAVWEWQFLSQKIYKAAN